LVKHYTKQNISEVKGPITVVAGVYMCEHVGLASVLCVHRVGQYLLCT